MGIAIVIDGMDGSGKTTLVRALELELEKRGRVVDHQAFPTHEGIVGSMIREIFKTPEVVDEKAMLPLFVADGMDFDQRLVQRLEACDFLICDRHPMVTTWAYQAGQHSVATLAAMTNPGAFDFIPDAVFILDVPPEIAIHRRTKRGEEANPMFEKDMEHTNDLRMRYQAFASMYANNGPVVLLDGTLSTQELVSGICSMVDAGS